MQSEIKKKDRSKKMGKKKKEKLREEDMRIDRGCEEDENQEKKIER